MNILLIVIILITSFYDSWCNTDEEMVKKVNEIFNHKNWIILDEDWEFYNYEETNNVYKKLDKINYNDHIRPNENTVNLENLTEKMKIGSIIMSSNYYNIVNKFYELHRKIKTFYNIKLGKMEEDFTIYSIKEIYNPDFTIIKNLNLFHMALNTFYPLITCMGNALQFFNHSTPVFRALNKLKEWQSNIKNFKEIDDIKYAEFVIKQLLDLNIFDENFKHFENNFKIVSHNEIYDTLYKSLKHIYNNDTQSLIPNCVQLFCADFGFGGHFKE